MCRPQCLLAFVFLSIGYAYSWDIALTVGDQLEFYQNGTKIKNEGQRFRDLTALAYDAVYNMLLFVDRQSDNASIFSYHLLTKKYQPLVKRKSFENIQGIAFDPVTSLLFWTDTNEKMIYWKSLKPEAKNDVYGNILFKMDTEIPRAIAIDSCRGYVYWTNTNITRATIERSRFDGTERTVIIDTDIYMPVSLAIDQETKTLYWADDKLGIHYSIESSDLEGKDRKIILQGTYHQPNSITVAKDGLYWVDFGYKSLWHFPKNTTANIVEPVQVATYQNEMPFGVAANYDIIEQLKGVPGCEAVRNLAMNKSAINDTFNIPRDIGLYCLHGLKVDGQSKCKCSLGFTGERCEISLCQNHCLNGDCIINAATRKPECSCNKGFAGERCEIDLCYGHCLNKGLCTIIDSKPVCSCSEGFEGERCEVNKLELKEPVTHAPVFVERTIKDECNCTNKPSVSELENPYLVARDDEFVESGCVQGWDSIRDPIIMVLGILCGLLCVVCAFLVTRVMKLKRRPRIKKRIIVNKNITPLTARPDQCEITIENCCNMNICETPCFEPRSTIKPSLLDAKPCKEEKKNLIANIEYPDDF